MVYIFVASVNFFDYFGAILSYILISIPVFYLGWYDHLSAVELSSLVSKVGSSVQGKLPNPVT